jgi:DNA-binding FrmR family transcriptional regulator
VRVREHPDYGGVTQGLHMPTSMHYRGRAADLNYGPPGTPPEERPVLLWAARLADAAGLNVIYSPHRLHPIAKTRANHWGHVHVDDGPITAYRPPGADDALYRRILAERPALVSNPVGGGGTVTTPTLPGAPAPITPEDDVYENDQPLQDALAAIRADIKAQVLASESATRDDLKTHIDIRHGQAVREVTEAEKALIWRTDAANNRLVNVASQLATLRGEVAGLQNALVQIAAAPGVAVDIEAVKAATRTAVAEVFDAMSKAVNNDTTPED